MMNQSKEPRQLAAGYGRADAPLAAYAGLVGLFSAGFAGFLVVAKGTGRPIPNRMSLADIVLLGVATHKLSRLLSKDLVTSFLRAPLAEYQGPGSPGEADETPRGTGWRLALGELIT